MSFWSARGLDGSHVRRGLKPTSPATTTRCDRRRGAASGRLYRERLNELAAHNDSGFDQRMFDDALARIQRYSDKQLAVYGLGSSEAVELRRRFMEWRVN